MISVICLGVFFEGGGYVKLNYAYILKKYTHLLNSVKSDYFRIVNWLFLVHHL